MEKPTAVLEIGNSAIKLVIGTTVDGFPLVIYETSKPLEGEINQGTIVEPDSLAEKLHSLLVIQDSNAKIKINVSEVTMILPPMGFEVYSNVKTTNVVSPTSIIDQIDINNVVSLVKKEPVPSGSTIVDIIPDDFVLDNGTRVFEPPLGMKSNSLTIEAKVHVLPKTLIEQFRAVALKAGFRIRRTLVAPYSAAILLRKLMPEIKNYVLIDMGSELTTFSLVGNYSVYGSTYILKGAYDLTKHISSKLEISPEEAFRLQKLYGYDNRKLSFAPTISTRYLDSGKESDVTPTMLNAPIAEFLQTYVNDMYKSLEILFKGYDDRIKRLPIVFVGGLSRLQGLEAYLKEMLPGHDDIIFYTPKIIGARSPSLVNSLGAILIASSFKGTLGDQEARVSKVERDETRRR